MFQVSLSSENSEPQCVDQNHLSWHSPIESLCSGQQNQRCYWGLLSTNPNPDGLSVNPASQIDSGKILALQDKTIEFLLHDVMNN